VTLLEVNPVLINSIMGKKRGFKDVEKGFGNRRSGIMKKGNTLHRLTGAHIAILIEFNGVVYSYQSDNHFSAAVKNVKTKQQYGPDDFDTVTDRGGPQSCSPDPQNQTALPSVASNPLPLSPSLFIPSSMPTISLGTVSSLDSLSSSTVRPTTVNSTSTSPDISLHYQSNEDRTARTELRGAGHQRRSVYPLAAEFF
jgi:hypothetical protein